MDHAGRLQRLRATLAENGFDFLLITHLPNVRYLCGFTGSAGALLISERDATLFTDGRYISQARAEVSGARIVIERKAPSLAAAETLAGYRRNGAGKRTVGFEGEVMPVAGRDRMAAVLPSRFRLRTAPPLVERARMVKDAEEIGCIRRAVDLGASLFSVFRKKIRPGARELEVAGAVEYAARQAGAEGMSFSTIVAAGKRSAVVHGRASAATIPRRGFVVCDFGVILAGYCSDRTRTVHVGHPSRAARAMYEAVLEAQQAAIARIHPGVTAAEVDGAARRVLRHWKLARYFSHSTGHGLGLEIHEAPRLAAAQTQRLEPGMVITVEPGAYIPGQRGVRIEDVVLVTPDGCEVLSPGDKELIVI